MECSPTGASTVQYFPDPHDLSVCCSTALDRRTSLIMKMSILLKTAPLVMRIVASQILLLIAQVARNPVGLPAGPERQE